MGDNLALKFATAAALCLSMISPTAALSNDLKALANICIDGSISVEDRARKIEAMSYKERTGHSDMWVQGQLAHIALGQLEYSPDLNPAEIKDTYLSFKESADAGELFRTDIKAWHLTNPAKNIEISLTDNEGDRACSISYGPGSSALKPSYPVLKTWTSKAGHRTEYRAGSKLLVTESVLAPAWDKLIGAPRLAHRFMIVGTP